MRCESELNHISRRDFFNRAAIGAAVLAMVPASLSASKTSGNPWPKLVKKYRFHMIGHGHIDPVWLWQWHEGVSVVHSTFRSALDRMNETPDFIFTGSSAQFYQWVADNDPAMLAEIRKRVDEGRWNIVGGWWIEPDVNIPSGEALARQGLYGQLTLQRLLGQRAKVAFNPDSFGHPVSLPQIIKLQGMDNYVFMRPGPHEKKLPAELFWWESPDGTRVLTYHIQNSYSNSKSIRNRLELTLGQMKDQPITAFMSFFGVGDHGGGPTKENILEINLLRKEKMAPTILYSSVDRYFEEMHANEQLMFPTLKDDLQIHAVGCYTAEWAIKKNNRLAEATLVTAEKISTVGSAVWKAPYLKDKFTAAWHKLLLLQFHDSLAGTSLFAHSRDARDGYGYVFDIAHEALYMAAQKLEWQIAAGDPASEYLVVFNAHAWEVNAYVAYDLDRPLFPKPTRVSDDSGRALPHQWNLAQSQISQRKRLVFNVTLPPMGYRQIRVTNDEFTIQVERAVEAEANRIENEYFRLSVSDNGAVGIFDKETGKEVFTDGATGCRAVMLNDPSDTWSHGVVAYADEIGAFGHASIQIPENGSLQATIRVITTYGDSKLMVDWSLYAGSRNIEANVTLDWHEQLKMLKFSFPVAVTSPTATYEVPYGHFVRETNGAEYPGQRWIDVTGKRGEDSYGLTIINDAKYGYSVTGNDLRISVARADVYAHHAPEKLDPDKAYLWMDQGIQNFRMWLIPHKEGWKESNIPRLAEEFIAPPVSVYQGIHKGTMPKSGSFLVAQPANVVVSSIKKAEAGNDIIIRCVETHGTAVAATLDFPSVRLQWKGNFRPCEIKTLRLNTTSGDIKEVNLLEE
jgi:alpha-mannosidase